MVQYLAVLLIIISALEIFSLPVLNTNCLDETTSGEGDCFTTFDEVAIDLGPLGRSISELATLSKAGKKVYNITDTPNPSKTLTLKILEEGVTRSSSISNSPLGYLTRYGYVKGILRAVQSCTDVIGSDELAASMLTFLHAQHVAGPPEGWYKMNKTRCSNPDITFDEEDMLDDSSALLISTALKEDTNLKEHASRLKREVESRRSKRYAIQKKGLDLAEKNHYSYRLHNTPDGLNNAFAVGNVNTAFNAWSDAIGPAITFTKVDEEADVNLKFVDDVHDDFTFSGDELAHAPFPNYDYHGNVHFRKDRNWNISDKERVDFTYITVHELGHWLGMKHSSVVGSVMQAILDPATIPEDYHGELNDDDKLGVKMLYGSESTNCPAHWHGFDSVCYIVQTASAGISWDTAQENCEEKNAMLVTINGGPLNNFLLETVANGRSPYWIGRKSTDDGWVSGQAFDWLPQDQQDDRNKKKMNPSSKKCLRAIAYSGSAWWEYKNCEVGEDKTEHYVCEKLASEFEITQVPTVKIPTTEQPDEPDVPEEVPCQNYIRGAIRRGRFLYIFGTNRYFKYYYTNSRPQLQPGYPRDISQNFKGIPSYFSAVVTNPYNRKLIYFIEDDDVYEWVLSGGKRSSLEEGAYRARGTGKQGAGRPKKLKSLFKTTNIIRGASTFDPNSILLFGATGEVGRWYKEPVGKVQMSSQYDKVEKWDYFETGRIEAVSEAYYKNYLIFFKQDEYFFMRKSDGRIPRKFRRNLSSDFGKLEICDVIAPFITEYPDNVNPDQALLEEDTSG